MKKFLIILITLAMCTAAFALAGCEDEKGPDSGNQTEQGGTEDGDQTEQGGGTEDGDSTNSGIVTQAEWEAAFDAKNFENYQFDGKSRPHGQESGISAIYARVESSGTSVKMYVEQTYSGTKTVNYYENTGDAAYKYDQQGDGWVRTVENYFTPDAGRRADIFCERRAVRSGNNNGRFARRRGCDRQGAKGDNITSTELAIENAAVTISFADGKIAGFSVDTKDETSTMQIRGSIEYESKEIVLPAIEEQ